MGQPALTNRQGVRFFPINCRLAIDGEETL